jgi:amino acid adenylation domain-containing protein
MHCKLSIGNTLNATFERVAKENPEHIAVRFGATELTYQALNFRANNVAFALIEKGVKPGQVVALLLDRGSDFIIAILAILKCGAAYLPLESSNPTERNVQCLNSADCKLIIAADAIDPLLNANCELLLTSETGVFTRELDKVPAIEVDENDKAYVMYTSGSTGTPKGVAIPHRAVFRLVIDSNYIDVQTTDKVFQFAPLSFDASTFEIWAPLLNGGTLVIYSGGALDPNLFAEELKLYQVTVLWLTAALFHLFANRYVELLKPVQTLLAGGDVLNPNLINKVLDAHPHMTIINGYGPTENTTFTCCHRMQAANRPQESVPIGKPVSGTTIHILDEEFNPVAVGLEGILYVSGKGVALGYINGSPSLKGFFTKDKLAPGLVYCTGDIVKQDDDGCLHFIGRADNQIKIRGYRVGLEEIQSNLCALACVSDAVVLLKKFESGEQLLSAYVQLNEGLHISVADLKRQLASRLPSYMIPELMFISHDLPISLNGKIDRAKIRNL